MIKNVVKTERDVRREVDAYVRRVASKTACVGELERACVRRYMDDKQHGKKRGLHFDVEKATRAVNFFPLLTLTTGEYANHPFELAPFQVFIVWNLFGWYKGDVRRFRHAFISMGRGNGKSPFAAGLLLYLFAFDSPREARAECYTVATKRDQARIVFDEAQRIVRSNAALRQHVKINLLALSLPDQSTLKPLGSDSKNTDGLVIHGVVADEVHAWREQHRDLWEKLETAMGKRRQPMFITITTAGNTDSDIWREQYQFSRAVLLRVKEADSHFAFSAEIDDADDPMDEAVWPKANPMLANGVVKLSHLQDLAAKAEDRPEIVEQFKRYHCNKVATASTQFILEKTWNIGRKPVPEFGDEFVYGGFDWGWADDLAAFAWVSRVGDKDIGDRLRPVYGVLIDAFIPAGSKRRLDKPPWKQWIDDGWLVVTDSEHTDPYEIFRNVERRAEQWTIRNIAFDRFQCDPLATRVINEIGVEMYSFAQTPRSFHAPTMELRQSLEEGRLLHGGNPLAGWCAVNMSVKIADEYAMPSKRNSNEKIDPVVALIMALGGAVYHERSVYDTAGQVAL